MMVHLLLSALLFVYSSSAFAEEKMYIDMQEDCLTKGGDWIPSPYRYYSQCYLDHLNKEDCQKIRGMFVFNVPGLGQVWRCLMPTSTEQIIHQCHEQGGEWGLNGARVLNCYFESERRQCLSEGGSWEKLGFSQIAYCVRFSSDGGKPCTSSTQCQFKCLATSRTANDDEYITGRCANNNKGSGCRSFVENGRFVLGPCVD